VTPMTDVEDGPRKKEMGSVSDLKKTKRETCRVTTKPEARSRDATAFKDAAPQ